MVEKTASQPSKFSRFRSQLTQAGQRILAVPAHFPFATFLLLLAALIAVIVIGNVLNKPTAAAPEEEKVAKPVTVYEVGGQPTFKVQAKVEKSGIIKLVAQTGGVVQKIKVSEGAQVKRSSSLFILSSNYQGSNAPALTRQISQKSYQFLVDNYDAQVQAINRNREIARKAEVQSTELRNLTRQSFDDTKGLISLNEEINRGLDTQIKQLEDTNVGGVNDATILQTKQAKAGILTALNGLRSGLRTNEYTASNDKETAELGRLGRDATLQQLDLQEKTLSLNKDLAQLNLRLAQVGESLMYPGSPCAGTVERIHVKPGQLVSPGTLLATIRSNSNQATAVVLASQSIAESISQLEPSYVTLAGQQIAVNPRNISKEPTDGSLHSILYSLPENFATEVTNDSYIEMTVPLGPGRYSQTNSPFIPLDAVYQGQQKSFVNVIVNDNGKQQAQSREVKLGNVTGQYVEVMEGLKVGDQVVTNRSVLDGEVVSIVK